MIGNWKHVRFMDVFIHVLREQYHDDKRTKLRVIWMNRGYTGNPWSITGPQTITIQRHDLKDWRPCDDKGN